MTLPSFSQLITGLLLLLFTARPAFSQQNKISTENTLYAPFTILYERNETALKVAPKAQLLTLNDAVLNDIYQQHPESFSIQLPWHGQQLVLDLVKTPLVTDDFTVITERSNGEGVSVQPGIHYRGAIRGADKSIVAFSFFEREIMGLASSASTGNLVLGRLDRRDNIHHYILYADHEMAVANPFNCHTAETGDNHDIQIQSSAAEVSKCVRVFLEADNELFIDKGSSVQNTVNYLTGMFNQVAALYANEQINTVLSQLFVWTTPDVYTPTNSATVLNQFLSFRTQFNGDIAHLVGTGGNNLGGIAYVDVLCTPYKVAFSDIATSYNTVPTYSWTVEVVTHEMGHNLGSRHTQWCGWSGGPIDNCVPAEGSCNPGPAPTNGGTIMSYCHLSNVGINFNNGFGPQPGNTIRNEVAGATCLATSCGSTNTCVAPGALTVTNITGSGANIGWTAVSGASGYTLRYRAVGNANWTTTTNPANPYTVTGFPANEEVEVTVQSICGGGSSEFSTGILFKTGSTGGSGGGGSGATCGTPTGLGVQASIASAVAYWQAVTGAGSYFVSWKSVNSSAWSNPISTTSTNYNITSLAASQTYNVQVLAVCSGVNSAAAVTTFTTASAGVICGNPANLSATTTTSTAQTSWSGVSGAYAYQIQWKSANTSTWGPLYAVTTTGLNITSLSPATSYNVRVRAVCNTNVSNFITTTFTTQSAGGGGSGGGNCNIPAGLTASYIYATSARVSWQPAQGALNYTMRIKRNDSPSWFTFSGLPVTIVTVQNLTPATTYNVEVRANCSGGAASNYCTTYSFTTPAGLIGSGNEDRGSELVIRETPLRLTAMPNPGNGFFYIRSANETVAIADIQVINSMGTTVLTQQNMRFTDGTAIDISDQPAGIYFVRFRSALADIPSLRLVKL